MLCYALATVPLQTAQQDSPNGVLPVAALVESAHVPPQLLVEVLHVAELLDHGPAEVDGEVGAIVVAPSMPAALVGVLLLVPLLGQRPAQAAQVEEALGRRRHDGARLQWLVARRLHGAQAARQQHEQRGQRCLHCGGMCGIVEAWGGVRIRMG